MEHRFCDRLLTLWVNMWLSITNRWRFSMPTPLLIKYSKRLPMSLRYLSHCGCLEPDNTKFELRRRRYDFIEVRNVSGHEQHMTSEQSVKHAR